MNNQEAPLQDCVVYARYSSHAQRDVSIEQQVADCEAYARSNGLRVVKVYADRHLHYYYTCQNRRTGGGCEKKNVVRDDVERAVVQATLDHILKDDVLQWVADSVMAYQERENNSAVLCGLCDDLAQNKREIENVLKAIRAGIITASTQNLLVELEAEGSRLENAIYLEEASLTHVERDFVVYWLEKFRGGNVNDAAFRRKVIDSLVNSVFLWDDHIRIAFNYSGKGSAVDLALVLEAEAVAGAEGSYKPSCSPPQTKTHSL